MSNETQHTPADVRERVAKEVYLWEATRFGAAESWALRSWEQESNTRRELYFNVADRILALLRAPRGEGEASGLAECIITCMGCGQDFDPHDDAQARYHEAACEVVDHEPARGESERRPRGAALRSEAQGEDRWEVLVFGPIIEAYNEAHAARRGEGGGE